MKLKAALRVQAIVRTYDLHTTPCAVTHKGDADAGTILIKLCTMDGLARVLTETRDSEGNPAWRFGLGATSVSEQDADAYISRQRDNDRDVWVLDIEDPTGTIRLTEPVLRDTEAPLKPRRPL